MKPKAMPTKTCLNINCPERTGGECNAPKAIGLILSELMLATSGVIKKYGNPTIHQPEANKELDEAFHEALAQIQQLLEECAPPREDAHGHPMSTIAGVKQQARNQAIDQYKSNIRGKLR